MENDVVKRVALAICPWVDRKKQEFPSEEIWANLQPESQKAYLEQAKAAIAAYEESRK